MNTYMFRFERNGVSKESPIIREKSLDSASEQVRSEIDEGWIVTSVMQNGTAIPEEQWPEELK